MGICMVGSWEIASSVLKTSMELGRIAKLGFFTSTSSIVARFYMVARLSVTVTKMAKKMPVLTLLWTIGAQKNLMLVTHITHGPPIHRMKMKLKSVLLRVIQTLTRTEKCLALLRAAMFASRPLMQSSWC